MSNGTSSPLFVIFAAFTLAFISLYVIDVLGVPEFRFRNLLVSVVVALAVVRGIRSRDKNQSKPASDPK